MKEFAQIFFDPAKCRRELQAFRKLLESKKQLGERAEIQRFFKRHMQLSAFVGTLASRMGPANQLAYEFPIFGDFAADIVVGNREQHEYCFIELEDGRSNGIFAKSKRRSTKDWGRRFEHGFSQLVDWFCSLDDLKKTDRFERDFGRHPRFFGLLLIGRNAGLSDADRARLKWRTDKVLIDSHCIECLTFDDLYHFLSRRISFYPDAFQFD